MSKRFKCFFVSFVTFYVFVTFAPCVCKLCDAMHDIAKTFLSVCQARGLWQNERNL